MILSQNRLRRELKERRTVVLDCTNTARFCSETGRYVTVSGRPEWARCHIAGSGHLDFTRPGLTDGGSWHRNTLPEPGEFALAMARLGIGPDSRIVLYDSVGSQWAARVWWMLRWIGFDNAAVLDGGLGAWRGYVETGESPAPAPGEPLTPRLRPEMFASREDVVATLRGGGVVIDALSEAQFSGRQSELGLKGHIPGACNIPAETLISAGGTEYRSEMELRPLFGWDPDQPITLYCGSGVAAASLAMVMTQLGYSRISIYMPGLQEWIDRPEGPKGADGV